MRALPMRAGMPLFFGVHPVARMLRNDVIAVVPGPAVSAAFFAGLHRVITGMPLA